MYNNIYIYIYIYIYIISHRAFQEIGGWTTGGWALGWSSRFRKHPETLSLHVLWSRTFCCISGQLFETPPIHHPLRREQPRGAGTLRIAGMPAARWGGLGPFAGRERAVFFVKSTISRN